MNKPETWKDIAKITWAVTLGIPRITEDTSELEVICVLVGNSIALYAPKGFSLSVPGCSLRSSIASSLYRAFPIFKLEDIYTEMLHFKLPVTPSFYIEPYDLVQKVAPKDVICQLDSYEHIVLDNINTLGVESVHVS